MPETLGGFWARSNLTWPTGKRPAKSLSWISPIGTLVRPARSPPTRFVRVSNVLLPPNSGAGRASGCREIPFGLNESTGHFSANTSGNSNKSCEPRKSSCYAVTACSAAPARTVLKSSGTTTSRSLVAQRVGRLPKSEAQQRLGCGSGDRRAGLSSSKEGTMQKQGTTWRYRAALAVLASCSLFAGAGADKKETPKPLPPEIVKAWRNAGAQVGWMKDAPPRSRGDALYKCYPQNILWRN